MSDRAIVTSRTAGACLAIAGLALSFLAVAEEGPGMRAAPLLPKYRQECASCHIAYPPGALPASSWQRILGNLQHHYGTDASLDPATVKQLDQWLTANAAGRSNAMPPPPEDRITRSAWFARTHDEVPAAVWRRPAIKSASNCAACHTKADQGNFNEHDVRIPR
ncbi:diheme cytochrome c [Ralstonia pickettii]|uniref:diheme cytochrome c n=1 Tax=Ralstonia pickettii TaxID=329 RepID=UPI002714A3B6|nr:diheme cytochrome c [Ralstonia pickettii]WKZ85444.1 diheme cytochrome c [Ralstonia pickettii]